MKALQDGRNSPSATLAREERQIASAATDAFLAAFRHHPAGVAILTGDTGAGPAALTVSSLISISATPPTVAFSLSESSSSARSLMGAETIVVHFAKRENMELARLCATKGGNRFGPDVRWARLATGEPYYPQVSTWFRAAIRGRLNLSGASLIAAEVLSGSTDFHEVPRETILVYVDRAWTGLSQIPISGAFDAPLLMWPEDSALF